MKHKCPYAYRKRGEPNILCRLLEKWPYCGNQYFCTNTKQTELTIHAVRCPKRLEAERTRDEQKDNSDTE